jgi:folate-binding protein YgfZ
VTQPNVPATAIAAVRTPLTLAPLDDAQRGAWTALHDTVTWVDRSTRRRFMFTGAKAADVLGGLVTNDVVALPVGAGQYAAALTPKGKVIADLRIVRLADDRVLVDTGALAGDGFLAMVKKYVNPRLAAHRDISAVTQCIGIYGPHAAAALQRLLETHQLTIASALEAMPPFHAQAWPVGDDWWIALASPDLGVTGFDLIVPTTHRERLSDALSGMPELSHDAAELARVAAGRPAWGIDMDDSTIPQEACLEQLHAISFEKGCYTGQEVVARLHFRGHVNKRLVRLLASGTEPLPSGAEVKNGDSIVGDVRSSGVLPTGAPVAIAMVRREVTDGATVSVGERDAVVHSLVRV